MRKNMIKALKWLFALLLIGFIAVWAPNMYFIKSKGTNVAFQSSDGDWADSEVLIKGRVFESIVVLFELYKIRCQNPDVVLQRITNEPNILSISRWFDNFNDLKWKVPYAEHHPNLKGAYYFPPVSIEHCYNGSAKADEIKMAEEHANQYLSSLASALNNRVN